MENIIKSWKGWRIEFEQEYGSDCDGACKYSSYSTFDWTIDLAEIIQTNMMGWLTFKNSGYDGIYLEEVSTDVLKVHFTCGYAIELTKEKPSYGYSFRFGHGDYRNTLRLIAPGKKADKIAKYDGPCFQYKAGLK